MTPTDTQALNNLDRQAANKARVLAELDRFPFRPPLRLRNPHLQTCYARAFRKNPPIERRVEMWDTPDGDLLQVFILDGDPDKPTLLMLHGLEGHGESNYVLGINELLKVHRWNVITLVHRSCGGVMNRAKRMYHSGASEDLDFAVSRLVAERPDIELYLHGVSLGGNVVGKWLGQNGDGVPSNIKAAAIVSAPYDLLASGPHMDTGVRRLYVRYFLKSLIPKAIEKERQYPGCVDIEAVKNSKTFREFDTHATAALHGFRDSEDYYAKVSCGQYLPGICRPILLLSAHDDPFNPGHTLPHTAAAASPWLHPQFPKYGGHVGFVMKGPGGKTVFWAEEQSVRFFLEYDRIRSIS